MKRFLVLAALVLFEVPAAWGQDSGSNYFVQGGKELVIGGALTVIDGGTVTMESGSTFSMGDAICDAGTLEVGGGFGSTGLSVTTAGAVSFDGAMIAGGIMEMKVASVTVADDAAGTKPAGVTPITAPIALCVCNDATGCTMSIAEPTVTSGYGRLLTIVSAGTGNCEYADAAGVTELSGALVLGPADTLTLVYANAAWHQLATSNN